MKRMRYSKWMKMGGIPDQQELATEITEEIVGLI